MGSKYNLKPMHKFFKPADSHLSFLAIFPDLNVEYRLGI